MSAWGGCAPMPNCRELRDLAHGTVDGAGRYATGNVRGGRDGGGYHYLVWMEMRVGDLKRRHRVNMWMWGRPVARNLVLEKHTWRQAIFLNTYDVRSKLS